MNGTGSDLNDGYSSGSVQENMAEDNVVAIAALKEIGGTTAVELLGQEMV